MSEPTRITRLLRIASVTALLIPFLLIGAVTIVAFNKPAQNHGQNFGQNKAHLVSMRRLERSDQTTTTTTTTAPPTTKPHVRNYTPVTTPPSGDLWERLRNCEAGGDYRKNTGNGYYGAYQFSAATWRSMGTAYEYAHLAPPQIQDAAAIQLQERSGWGQWPACSRTIGVR